MTNITTRSAVGRPLSYAEMDGNFNNLNSGKAEVSVTDSLQQQTTTLAQKVASALQQIMGYATSIGSSMIGFIQAGTGATPSTLQAKARERITINDFGADPSASAAVNTAAIKAALLACPSGGMVEVGVGGTYAIASSTTSPITMNKRLIFNGRGAVFQHDGVSTGILFKLGKDSGTPTSDKNFNGQLEYLVMRNLTIQGAKIPNGAVDNRTSVCDALVLDGGLDGAYLGNISIEGFRAAGLKFAGNGSIRESYFTDITLRYCGDAVNRVCSLDVANAAQGGDPHNEIHWKNLRIIYSAWGDLHVKPHPSGANTAGWPRLWYFNNFQFENESSTSNYWNTAPDVEKVWLEGCVDFFFDNGNSINSYGTDNSKWGRPHFRLGNASAGYVAQSITVTGMHFQNSGPSGYAIQCENVGVLKQSGGSTFQFANPMSQGRSVAVGVIDPTAVYGTLAAPGQRPYILNDISIDLGLGPIVPDSSYLASIVGRRGLQRGGGIGTVIQNSGGFTSGIQSIQIPNGGGVYTIDMLPFLPVGSTRDALSGSHWKVTADIAFYGNFAISGITVDLKCLDSNTVAPVFIGPTASNNGSLVVTATTYSGATAGSVVGDAGGKFQVSVTNTTGQTLSLNVQAVRLGG